MNEPWDYRPPDIEPDEIFGVAKPLWDERIAEAMTTALLSVFDHFEVATIDLDSVEAESDRVVKLEAELERVTAERDALLEASDVSREELAIELCREIGAEVYQLVNGDIDQMCGIVGIHEPEGWLSVADALLATWRVVRR